MGKPFWVYILCNRKQGALYCGHTDDLARRVFAHRQDRGSVFTRKYKLNRLVWYEPHDTREAAKRGEYQIKTWKRDLKIRLIETNNLDWDDLYLKLNH